MPPTRTARLGVAPHLLRGEGQALSACMRVPEAVGVLPVSLEPRLSLGHMVSF